MLQNACSKWLSGQVASGGPMPGKPTSTGYKSTWSALTVLFPSKCHCWLWITGHRFSQSTSSVRKFAVLHSMTQAKAILKMLGMSKHWWRLNFASQHIRDVTKIRYLDWSSAFAECCLAHKFVRQVECILLVLVLVLVVTAVHSSFVIRMNESSCDDFNCTISLKEVRKSHRFATKLYHMLTREDTLI